MQFRIDNPLLTLAITIALGAAFVTVRFGPLRFGAAGALFVGLLIGAFDTEEKLGTSLGLVKTLGLGLFIYMVRDVLIPAVAGIVLGAYLIPIYRYFLARLSVSTRKSPFRSDTTATRY